jgi:hypothetical protein
MNLIRFTNLIGFVNLIGFMNLIGFALHASSRTRGTKRRDEMICLRGAPSDTPIEWRMRIHKGAVAHTLAPDMGMKESSNPGLGTNRGCRDTSGSTFHA